MAGDNSSPTGGGTDRRVIQPQPKKSDLPVRAASAVVMVALAGTALWLGGWVWTVFVAVAGCGVLWEWRALTCGFAPRGVGQAVWLFAGVFYIGFAMAMLIALRGGDIGTRLLLMIILGVVGTDVGAFFIGRTFGGPKIAPAISPSKTWSGLIGGAIGATAMLLLVSWLWSSGLCGKFFPSPVLGPGKVMFDGPCSFAAMGPFDVMLPRIALVGLLVAVVAQAGDFFESWMKRQAGVKDSSNLIPGHGGLFDRADGLLAVTFVIGLLQLMDRL